MHQGLLLLFCFAVEVSFASPHVTYSCDGGNASSNVLNAASLGRAGKAGCAVCPNADVSTCWISPAEIWAQIEPLPAGRRAISLEGFSPYYCEDANTTKWWWQDKLSDGSRGPWGDVWAKEVLRRFDAWFAAFKALGGEVDVILSDFEMGGKAYWYTEITVDLMPRRGLLLTAGTFPNRYGLAFQPTSKQPQDALVKDARWPALLTRLNGAGKPWNASFDDLSDMQEWTSADPRALVWDMVVVDGMVPEYLNASVYAPIAARFPDVQFSNFAHSHHTDPTGVAGPLPAGHGGWPFTETSSKTPIGTGSHVGTHQSKSIYSEPNSTLLVTQVVISPAPPLHLPCTSPAPPLHLPCTSHASLDSPRHAERREQCSHFAGDGLQRAGAQHGHDARPLPRGSSASGAPLDLAQVRRNQG